MKFMASLLLSSRIMPNVSLVFAEETSVNSMHIIVHDPESFDMWMKRESDDIHMFKYMYSP